MHKLLNFYPQINIGILKEFIEEKFTEEPNLEKVTLCHGRAKESFRFVLVIDLNPKADPKKLVGFWGNACCDGIWHDLADTYIPPLKPGEHRDEWMCLVQPAGSGLPTEFVRPESAVVLQDRDTTAVGQIASEELSDDPPKEFSIEPITYDPAKRKGFRFNVSLKGQEKEFFKKGWQVLNILSRYCGEEVPYDVVYRLYTETAATPDDSSHKSKTKGDKLTFQKLAPATSGEKEDNTNVRFGTTERTLEKTDQKTIDDVVKKIEEVKENERALIEDRHQEDSEILLKVREDLEALEDYLSGNARLTLDEQGETVCRPKYEKSRLAKKKSTIKKAIKGAKKEAEDAWPDLHQYLHEHLKVEKDFLRLT